MSKPDDKLIEAFQQGDEFAFVVLYNRYKGPVYAFCTKMLLDRAVAQDVMQETFVRVYENRQRLMAAIELIETAAVNTDQPQRQGSRHLDVKI